MLQSGTFHTTLRLAIEARGLGLARLRERLAERGVPISVSTLSSWQRGISRPNSPAARRALPELEDVLGLPRGTLSDLVAERLASGRWHELGPGTPPRLADELRQQLGATDRRELTVLSILCDVRVSQEELAWTSRNRIVVRANTNGASQYVTIFHANAVPALCTGTECTLGRTLYNDQAGLTAAELLFAPLAVGETYPIEYQMSGQGHDSYHGTWIRTAGVRYELTIRFDPQLGVRSAYRIQRLDVLSPHKDVGELRLIGNEVAHMVDPDATLGFHGIRWE